ncbi:hypothetical protein TNCV_2003311 [Trichonephila clavipes]|nr:hypothetical protein TNCV_2003311 [Trichonephila clavipes]
MIRGPSADISSFRPRAPKMYSPRHRRIEICNQKIWLISVYPGPWAPVPIAQWKNRHCRASKIQRPQNAETRNRKMLRRPIKSLHGILIQGSLRTSYPN